MKKQISTLLGVSLLVVAPFVNAAPGQVEVSEGKLSASFDKTRLSQGLNQLSSKTGVQFLLDQELTGELNTSVAGVPVDYGIKRLLSSFNHVAFYRAPAEKGQKPQLYRIKVFRPGAEKTAQYKLLGAASGAAMAASQTLSGGSAEAAVQATESTVTTAGVVAAESSTKPAQVYAAAQTGNAYRAVAESQRKLAMLRHKAQAEERAIRAQMAEVREELATGDSGDAQANLEKLDELQGQLARSKQSNAQQMMAEQKDLQNNLVVLAEVDNPQQQLDQAKAIKNRQQRTNYNDSSASQQQSVASSALASLGSSRDSRGHRR